MSTAINPTPAIQMKQRPKALGAYFRGAREEKDGGWGKLKKFIADGRAVCKEEALRWQENREYYRGNQSVYIAPGESQLRGVLRGPMGATTDGNSYNRLRQFADGRTSLLTKEVPPYEVIPEDRDQESIDGSKQAEKFIAARWGENGWNIAEKVAELFSSGDIDGVAWLSVTWDPDAAGSRDQLIAVTPDGQPITDRSVYETLRAQDPTAQKLWRMERSSKKLGDVLWRVIQPGAISVDPFAEGDSSEARWICESRIRPREEVERRLGMKFKDAVKVSADAMGEKVADVQFDDIKTDGGRTINERNGVVVHYFYARPCEDFPSGLHIEFCDKAPGKPLVMEEWEDDLPYKAFTPRPDTGHFLRSKGIVDDLKPIQRDYNATLRDLREWLKRVARTPVALPFGSMASDSYFNEEGVFFYHPQMGEPHHSNVPAEPTAVLSHDLARMVEEMRDISGVSASAQGLRAPGGPEAAVGINLEIQQTENNLSRSERRLKSLIEWGVGRSLVLVEKHYAVARAVTGVGVDDSEEFAAFQGAMLRGAHRFRITGPLMPKSKAARMAAIQQLVPLLGERVLPFLGGLIDGDPTELAKDIEVDRNRQKGETRELIGLAGDEKALLVHKNFEEDKQAFSQAFNIAVQEGSQNPILDLAQSGVRPPNLTQSLLAAGFDLPLVEDFNNHALELKALDEFRKSDAYRKLHPMGKQLLLEHAQEHQRQMAQQVQAMAAQMPDGTQGSAPKELGTPSAPRNTPQPVGGMG